MSINEREKERAGDMAETFLKIVEAEKASSKEVLMCGIHILSCSISALRLSEEEEKEYLKKTNLIIKIYLDEIRRNRTQS